MTLKHLWDNFVAGEVLRHGKSFYRLHHGEIEVMGSSDGDLRCCSWRRTYFEADLLFSACWELSDVEIELQENGMFRALTSKKGGDA